MKLQDLINALVGLLRPLIPLIGSSALSASERLVTIPESQVRKMCAGMSEADTVRAIELGHKMADATSDFATFVASRGQIQPD